MPSPPTCNECGGNLYLHRSRHVFQQEEPPSGGRVRCYFRRLRRAAFCTPEPIWLDGPAITRMMRIEGMSWDQAVEARSAENQALLLSWYRGRW